MRMSMLALAALLSASLAPSVPAADAAKIHVLLWTGDDVKVHNWKETAPATRDILAASGRFDVTVSEDPAALDSADALKAYQVIYVCRYNASTPTLGEAGRQNLLDFVKGGKGLVVTHLSSASFKDWDEWKKLCGRYWVMGKSGHGPRGTFKVHVVEKADPVMQGLEDFETSDELYAKLQGDAPIRTLATADSDFSKKTEPLVFTTDYGQGRVFSHTFGHDVKALEPAAVRAIVVRGTEWAATGKVQ